MRACYIPTAANPKEPLGRYPLWIRDVKKGAPWWLSFHGSELFITPPPEWVPDRNAEADSPSRFDFDGYAEAEVKLSDQRTLKLEIRSNPYRPDGLITVQLPPQVVTVAEGPPLTVKLHEGPTPSKPAVTCEAERKQVESLTASTRDLSRAMASLAERHSDSSTAVDGAAQMANVTQPPPPVVIVTNGATGGMINLRAYLGAVSVSEMGEKTRENWMPKEPLPFQKLAKDCKPSLGEQAIHGGCWVEVGNMAPPCGDLFRNGDKCYRPVAADPTNPVGASPTPPGQ